MCGIVGIMRWDGEAVSRAELERLNTSLTHRGPDEAGIFVDNAAGLAMRRLSIIDLSQGSQPMYTPDKNLVIVFNGEIYNYQEVRRELEAAGTQFRTHSDTEVILLGYERWGAAVLERLNGMWGLAIYDRRRHELFLSRDRLGKKQIYYAVTSRYIVFGSEMKIPMLAAPEHRRLRLSALPEYLTYSYVGGPETALEGVGLLPEAHYAIVNAPGKISLKRYWRISGTGATPPKSDDEAAEQSYSLLVDAVRKRLVADVPIAVMLSSGLDSSSLAYVLSHELSTKLKTFSLGYDDSDFDESMDAGDLARELDLPWERQCITGKAVAEHFPRFIHHVDSLQGNTGQLVYYFVSEMIRRAGFKVALNGGGGDELFAGYTTYRADEIFRWYRFIPRPLRYLFHQAATQLPTKFARVSFDYMAKKFTSIESRSLEKAHASWRTIFSPTELRATLSERVHPAFPSFTSIYDAAFEDAPPFDRRIGRFLYADLKAWLIPMLPWVDNISMAHSIELRLPYLDYRLVDHALGFPGQFLFRGWKLKRLMKRFLERRLPDRVLYRPKRGTHLPLSRWLNNELREFKRHYLEGNVLNREGLFNMAVVNHYLTEHEQMKADHTFKLWNLIIFSAWKEENRVTV